MSLPNRIALIHATRVAIDPIETAAKAHWPDVELISIMEEALSADSATNRVSQSELNNRIVQLARYAEGLKPDGILYTCSAFGKGIEKAAATSHLPVLKPNEAMFEKAFSYGNDIAMVYTFEPAVVGMEAEFREESKRLNLRANIRSVFAKGAIEALREGDQEQHNECVANVVAKIEGADAILLAHFSTANSAALSRTVTNIPVLTSPESAILKMQEIVRGRTTAAS